MGRSKKIVQSEASAPTEGARRATEVGAEGAADGAGPLTPGQRWSAGRKRDVVLRLLRGESLEALSRELSVEIYRLEAWRERALAGLELGLKDRHGEPAAEALDAAMRHIGGAVDGERAFARAGSGVGATPPFADAEVAAMSETTSAATGRCYGLQRVCQAWERSRSALYARRTRAQPTAPGRGARAARTEAEAIGRAAAGGDSGRPRPVPVSGRGPSQGPRASADPGRNPRRPDPSVARHAGRTACSPRTAGVRAPR